MTPDPPAPAPHDDPARPTPHERAWADRLADRIRANPYAVRAQAFFHRHPRYMPALFFVGGACWDALTLGRIDEPIDNALLFLYVAALSGVVVLASLVAYERTSNPLLLRYSTWYPAATQFLLGALFSAYVIYYSQSASFSETSIYLLVLVGLLVANEFIHERQVNLYLLFALHFLAASSFFVFFIPVLAKKVSYATFLAGELVSLGVSGAMLGYLYRRGLFARMQGFMGVLGMVTALMVLLNVFYLANWIPPVPLALRAGGIYHHVHRDAEADAYVLVYEDPPWYKPWVSSDERFHHAPGDTIFCFTAVFAPTQLSKKIYHAWRYYDPETEDWVFTDRISYDIVGARVEGYRGYTFKRNLHPGPWRVDVETDDGRVLGRLRFELVPVDSAITDLKQSVYR